MARVKCSFIRVGLLEFLATPSNVDFSELSNQGAESAASATRDAILASGFPIKITLRAALPDSHDLLLCLEEGSVVQRAERKSCQLEAEISSILDAVAAGIVLFDPTGHLRFSNAHFAQYFSLDPQQLRKLEGFDELDSLVAKRFRDPRGFAEPWKSFSAGEGLPRHDELELTCPSKRILERFSRPVLDREGRAVGWLEPYNDVGRTSCRAIPRDTTKMHEAWLHFHCC
jgi:PAS domain-containing protein